MAAEAGPSSTRASGRPQLRAHPRPHPTPPPTHPQRSPLGLFFARLKDQLSRPSLLSSSGASEDDDTMLSESWEEYAARLEGVGVRANWSGSGSGNASGNGHRRGSRRPEPDLTTAEGVVAASMAEGETQPGAMGLPPEVRGALASQTRTASAGHAGHAGASRSGTGSDTTAVDYALSVTSGKGPGSGSTEKPGAGAGAGAGHRAVHKVVLDADWSKWMDGTVGWENPASQADGDGDDLSDDDSEQSAAPRKGVEAEGQPGMLGRAARMWGRGSRKGSKTSRTSERPPRRLGKVGKTVRWLREGVWPNVYFFFDMSFPEESKEREYRRQEYHTRRQLAIAAACFFLLAWILSDATLQNRYDAFEWYMWVGIFGGLTIPLLPLVLLNSIYYIPWLYQIFLFLSTWVLPEVGIITMRRCGIYGTAHACDARSFYITFAAAVGSPTLALLALGQNRFFGIIGPCQLFVLIGALLMNRPDTPRAFYRDCVFGLLYNAFIIGISFIFERNSRQLFQVRQQLKVQYRATQRAQLMEKKAADLKKRFVSYIFHEVRVPLNTALLAVQNLDGEQAFVNLNSDQEEMVAGLAGSLGMMEKVLNDVLSFNRFESGRLSLCAQPFDLGRVIDLTAMAHQPAAHNKGLRLETKVTDDLRNLGGHGLVLGDEMRLRQIISNLVSNAIKFAANGSVTIAASILWTSESFSPSADSPTTPKPALEQAHGNRDPEKAGEDADADLASPVSSAFDPHKRCAIIRLEVRDTGVGLRPVDIQGDRLFSPYVQTELGRRQGGKGTGLGLALVYQIVQLAKGRLGVDSNYGEGSTFWLEMPFGLPELSAEAVVACDVPFATPTGLNTIARSISPQSYLSGSCADTIPADLDRVASAPGVPPVLCPAADPSASSLAVPGVRPPPLRHTTTRSTVSLDQARVDRAEELALQRSTSRKMALGSRASLASLTGQGTNLALARSKSSDAQHPSAPSPAVEPEPTIIQQILSPESVPSASPAVPVVPTETASHKTALNALVVDDDKLTRTLMSRMLKRLGHQTTMAEDGVQARDRLLGPGGEGFDVVFLDNQMPHMSGVELARFLRTLDPPHPVYIAGCTGNALKEDQDEYRAAGADVILTKPIKQAAVEEVCRLALVKAAEKPLRGAAP